MATPTALHSSETNEHYTPPEVIEAARVTLGGVIDLDPASCAVANRVVKARCFAFRDGLDIDWTGPDGEPATVWLNPPGGKSSPETFEPLPRDATGKQNGPGLATAAVWWWKLLHEIAQGHVKAAVFEAFSMNLFQTAQHAKGEGKSPPHMFPICVPAQRLRHYNDPAEIGKGQPSQPNAIILLRNDSLLGSEESAAMGARFVEHFGQIGATRL